MRFTRFVASLAAVSSITAIEVDCSMADTTPCDCIYAGGTLPGTDCRVCRVEKQLACVLWSSSGTRYGPLCDPSSCPEGKSWADGTNTPGKCYCDWTPKVHEREPCPTPAGDCKCTYVVYNGTQAITVGLPGEKCTVCPSAGARDPYVCTETGNKKNGYGPLCTGPELGPDCKGKGCVCNWMTTMSGVAWRNDTVG